MMSQTLLSSAPLYLSPSLVVFLEENLFSGYPNSQQYITPGPTKAFPSAPPTSRHAFDEPTKNFRTPALLYHGANADFRYPVDGAKEITMRAGLCSIREIKCVHRFKNPRENLWETFQRSFVDRCYIHTGSTCKGSNMRLPESA